jgi:hypothetical protein
LPNAVAAMGNGGAFGFPPTEDPFIIIHFANGWKTYASLTDQEAGGSHTVRIAQKKNITAVKQLDIQYSPAIKYVEPKEIDILPLTQFDGFAASTESFGLCCTGRTTSFNLTIGESYIVNWDGETYTCECYDVSSFMGMECIGVGNGSDFGYPGNNEPFIILCVIANNWEMYVSLTDTADGNSHTVRIYQNMDGYHALKDEYHDWDKLSNKPFGYTIGEVFKYTFNVSDVFFNQITLEDNSNGSLIANETYTIMWNGQEYKSKCISASDVLAVGNIEALNGGVGNGVPFVIVQDSLGVIAGKPAWIVALTGTTSATTITFSIFGAMQKYLDNKYLKFPEAFGLPKVTTDDNNKVLTVVEGEWTVQTPASGLPDVSSVDNGKFLRVVSGAWSVVKVDNAEGASF